MIMGRVQTVKKYNLPYVTLKTINRACLSNQEWSTINLNCHWVSHHPKPTVFQRKKKKLENTIVVNTIGNIRTAAWIAKLTVVVHVCWILPKYICQYRSIAIIDSSATTLSGKIYCKLKHNWALGLVSESIKSGYVSLILTNYSNWSKPNNFTHSPKWRKIYHKSSNRDKQK